MTADIRPIRPVEELNRLDSLTAFDRFIAAYPRKQSIGRARQQWMWALTKVNNDHQQIIDGAERAAKWHMAKETVLEFIPLPSRWLADEGWLDSYELPKAPVQSPQEARDAMRKLMERKAAEGCRFSQDWLKRNT